MIRMIPRYSASSRSEIERRAHELFERAGRPAGCDLDHWLQAEADYLDSLRCHPAGLAPVGAQLEPQATV